MLLYLWDMIKQITSPEYSKIGLMPRLWNTDISLENKDKYQKRNNNGELFGFPLFF